MDSSTTSSAKTEKATLAGGCFWGVEELLRTFPGVISTEVGYTGGSSTSPRDAVYDKVKLGNTGHAEAIQVVFDPSITSFAQLLDFFFTLHDPTTLNQQGNDVGSQYRSAIFYQSEVQRVEALAAVSRAEKSGLWKNPVVTEITPAQIFFSAESYHQKYLVKNPGGYTCHFVRKINK